MQLFSADATTLLLLFFFCPRKHKKTALKVAHNPTRLGVFSPTSFFFVIHEI